MEPARSKSSANSTTRAGGSAWVDDLIGQLNLHEREEDDLNFNEEFPDEGEAVEFMAIARVHTDKPFLRGAFYENMRMAWSLAQGVTFNALGENLFSITVNCMGGLEEDNRRRTMALPRSRCSDGKLRWLY
ncbi:hypothetical protein D1007_09069 [Hordeum vulgare]|nr:hypothetical protein D1007_09069 [Hordeum vulgare]